MSPPEFASLRPPPDPRLHWDLPDIGAMPTVAVLDETVVRVLAPNPSPMTLDGTNTYVIGTTGHQGVIVVDPGPQDPGHLERVRTICVQRDAHPEAIVVTHRHHDHAAAAATWADVFRCPIVASTRAVAGHEGRIVRDGDHVGPAGVDVEVVATPGHTSDHVALRLETGALLTGDHVLGRGTSVVAHPDGDLEAYLASLRRVLRLGPDVLYPGHGPELVEDPTAVLRYYDEHRRYRERQLLAAVTARSATPRELVASLYADVDPKLWPAAEASLRAALAALVARGLVTHDRLDRVVRRGSAEES
jgi:glyoxylase-like metal-dependent hydrolase (beta-lactamase superfamily II)